MALKILLGIFTLVITLQIAYTSTSKAKNITLRPVDLPRLPTPAPLVADSNGTLQSEQIIVHDYQNEERTAKNIMDAANSRMFLHWLHLRERFLSSNQKYNQKNYGSLNHESETELRHFVNNLATNLSVFHIKHFKNKGLKRQIKLLCKLQLQGLPDEKYLKARNYINLMKNLFYTKQICRYSSDCYKDTVSYWPDINDVIEKSQSEDKLRYYWNELRDTISPEAKKSLVNYIDLFREAAIINGHYAASKTWYLYYEEDYDFLNELEAAVNDIMPLYKELHAYMRNILRNKYGAKTVGENEPIPQHLIEQVISHAWKAKALFQPPYPNRILPDIKKEMDNQNYTPLKLIEIAKDFYTSMGVNLNPNFTDYTKKMSDEEAGDLDDCKAETYYFPPDVALKYCPKVDFKKLLQIHGHLAEIHYNYQRGRLPYGLDRQACPGFGDAIGEASIIAAGSPRHLESINLWNNYALDSQLITNRLFRMGVHTIFTIPMHFVNEKFWVDAIDNNIQKQNLNCGYWNLQQKYAGVGPPRTRSNKYVDFGYKFYTGINPEKATTKKLLSELLGYQFYRSLCIKSGQYVPNNDSYPLHNCDFSYNRESGKYINEMLALGSTKKWRNVMKILTGETIINGKAVLEYYKPLHDWLKIENAKNNVSPGWEDTDSCDEDESD